MGLVIHQFDLTRAKTPENLSLDLICQIGSVMHNGAESAKELLTQE